MIFNLDADTAAAIVRLQNDVDFQKFLALVERERTRARDEMEEALHGDAALKFAGVSAGLTALIRTVGRARQVAERRKDPEPLGSGFVR